MKIRIDSFKGMAPRVQPRQLPSGFAQAATNAIVETGTLRPLRAPSLSYTFGSNTLSFLRHNSAWYGWSGADVMAAPGPVAQDRVYVFGDGAPKLLYQGDTYALALAAPSAAPTVAFTNKPAAPVPNDPNAALTLPASGGTVPAALRIVRQPRGSISGRTMMTQPALCVVDEAGLLCASDNTTQVTVSVGSGALGFVSGTTTITAASGVIRFTDLVMTGDHEESYRLKFEAEDMRDRLSRTIAVSQDMDALASNVLYAYTFVTSLGEESPPSPLSASLEWYPGLIVRLSNFSAAPGSRLITKMRIYRTETSAAGITDLYFVAEVNASTLTYDHNLATAPIVEVIPSSDYDTPPASAKGVVALPNGMMAAHTGREVLFSEPYQPHAWPTKYRLTTEYDIVGLGAFGASLAVLTKGTPYIITGSSPETMVMEKLEVNLPCLSARGIADLGYSIAYPSVDGLVTIGPNGAAIVTKGILTRDQWQALGPSTLIAEPYSGLYVGSHVVGPGAVRALAIFDVSGETPFMLKSNLDVRAMHTDIATGTLYVIQADDLREVRAWDAGAASSMTWKSGIARTGMPVNFGAALIEASAGGTTAAANIYADGALVGTIPSKNVPARLPSGFLASEWEIEITGTAEVHAVTIASTMEDLTND